MVTQGFYLELESVRTEIWEALFDVFGMPEGLVGLDIADIVRAYDTGRFPAGATEAVDLVRTLGNEEGRERIYLLAGEEIRADWEELSPSELVLHLCLRKTSDAGLARLLECARVGALDPSAKRVTHMSRARQTVEVTDVDAVVFRLEEALRPILQARHFGAYLEVHLKPADNPRELHFVIFRGTRPRKTVEIEEDTRRKPTARREAAHDSIRFIPPSSLKVVAGRGLRTVYRRAAGKALGQDPELFGDQLVFVLDRLVGPEAVSLDDLRGSDIRSVSLKEIELSRDTGTRHWIRNDDGISDQERRGANYAGTRVREIKLAFEFRGPKPNKVTAVIRDPDIISVDRRFELRVDEFLRKAELLAVATKVETRSHLWDIYDRDITNREGEQVFGNDWSRLVREEVFVAIEPEVVRHPARPAASPNVKVSEVDGRSVGVSDGPESEVLLLSPTDLVAYRLASSRLAALLSSALGLAARPVVPSPFPAGWFSLGQRVCERCTLHFYLGAAPVEQNTAQLLATQIRSAVGDDIPVLLLPMRHGLNLGDLKVFEFESAWGDLTELFPRLVRRLRLTDRVDVIEWALHAERLVVDVPLRRAWIDRVELRGFGNKEGLFEYTTELARHSQRGSRRGMTGKELCDILEVEPSQVTRFKNALRDVVTKSFEQAGRESAEVLAMLKEGYLFDGNALVFEPE